MKKITAYIVLVLFVVVFHFGQNAHSASSALTEPPSDMSDINEMHKVLLKKNSKIRFGTHADPKVITLGPKKGGKPGFKPYKGKHSLDIDMPLDTPILAPIDMTFIGCENQLAYGTVGMINGKIVGFDRNITFNAVKVKNRNNFTAFAYSGMPIMNVDLLKMKFKNYANFEKNLFPKLIKKFKCNFVDFTGFWHSIDNTKDIEVLKKINNNF